MPPSTTGAHRIYIIGDRELRVVRPDDSVAQKLLTFTRGASTSLYWSAPWVFKIAALLCNNHKVRELYPDVVEHLAWLLTRAEWDYEAIVRDLMVLCERHSVKCARLDSCVPPPSIAMSKDSSIKKVLASYKSLQDKLSAASATPNIDATKIPNAVTKYQSDIGTCAAIGDTAVKTACENSAGVTFVAAVTL